MTITIDGTDRSDTIEWSSLRIQNRRNKADTCSFTVTRTKNTEFKPSLTKEVVIQNGATKEFAGIIIKIQDRIVERSKQVYRIKCKDYTRYLERRRVPDTFSNQTVNAIISSLISNYWTGDGITDNNVDCPVTLNDIRYDYERGDDCIERLARYTNYNWYIDYDKDIHFFAQGDEQSPFKLTDDSGHADCGKFAYDSLEIIKDDRQIKNVVYVKGGEYLGATWTDIKEADGDRKAFRSDYKLKSVSAWVDSGTGYVAQTVGVDGLDSFTNYDCLYNYNEKTLKFPDASKPANGDLVKISGDPRLPVITKMSSGASKATFGTYEATVVDKRIKTKEAAKERAEAELEAYMDSLVDAKFETTESGLKAGQEIEADITKRGISETFIIKDITKTSDTHDSLKYSVKLMSAESMEVIEFFQKIIKKIDSGIEFKEDEQQNTIIDLVKSFTEDLVLSENVSIHKPDYHFDEDLVGSEQLTVYKNNPPTWVYGPYNPTGHSDRKKPAYYNRNCSYT